MRTHRDLTAREQVFCGYLALLGTPFEAARRAGYARTQRGRAVAELLRREEVQRQVEGLSRGLRDFLPSAALAGLARAAFGDVTDAVRLAALEREPTPEEWEEMDLFAVSEVTRGPGGAIKVKLLDRVLALQLLLEYTERMEGSRGMELFLTAIDRGAAEEAPAAHAN